MIDYPHMETVKNNNNNKVVKYNSLVQKATNYIAISYDV